MFVSDIHGNVEVLEELIQIFEEEKADKLIMLGDTSASNQTDNEAIASILNQMAAKIEVILGNCDNLMLEDRLDVPMYDIDNLNLGDNTITITHGHRYNMYDLPPFARKHFYSRAYTCANAQRRKRNHICESWQCFSSERNGFKMLSFGG